MDSERNSYIFATELKLQVSLNKASNSIKISTFLKQNKKQK